MNYIMYFDWSALVVYLVILLNIFFKKTVKTQRNKVFFLLLIFGLCSTLMDLVASHVLNFVSSKTLPLAYILNILYFLSFNALAPIYLIFVLNLTEQINKLNKLKKHILFLPYLASALMIVTTSASHGVFYFDGYEYAHGVLFYVLYVIAEGYLLAGLILTIIHSKRLSKERAFSAYFFMVGNIITVFVQIFIPNILITQIGIALSILLIYMTLQNPEDYFDSIFGLLNRKAFVTALTEKLQSNKSVDIVALTLPEIGYLNQTLGMESGDKILLRTVEELKKISEIADLYKISNTKFAYMADGDKNIFDFIPQRLNLLFSSPFDFGDLSVLLTAPTCCIAAPETVNTAEEANSLIDYYLDVKANSSIGNVMWAEKEVLNNYDREKRIIALLQDSVMNDGFEVLYQPIFSTAEKRFLDVEALVRLKSTGDLGFVGPDEFIPLAEKNGLIRQIGIIVLKKVCELLASGRHSYIKHINVNLSVVQCMQEELHEELTMIIDSFNVKHDLITLEITETSAANSAKTLKHNMQKLISNGILFAMDDFGVGNSTAGYLIDYPFSIVKLDKHLVWEAFKNEKAKCVLKSTISMIKEMDMTIVAEGVETEEQAAVLSKLGCDLLQGYLFSKPISEIELIEFLDSHTKVASDIID